MLVYSSIGKLAAGVMIIMVACLNCSKQPHPIMYPPYGNVLAGDPLYDEISANNKQVFATQPSPALPTYHYLHQEYR